MTTTLQPFSLSDYDIVTGRFDECRDSNGNVRPEWTAVQNAVGRLGTEGLNERSTQIQHWIRENGSTFQAETVDGSQTRPWQLASLPVAFDQTDWDFLSRGLSQRVAILEDVLDDLLGPQRLIKERVLPPELLWDNPGFYRAYHQLLQQNGPPESQPGSQLGGQPGANTKKRLHVTACDVVRGDNGTWWVNGDRTRAPSGLGYLLENRIVYSRTFPHLHRRANVTRLAPFFESMREHFRSLAPREHDNPRVGLLTPGSGSYREFEDAYLARYLGYTLVQGQDLAVRGQRLNLKTLGGLLPIEVLWRHVSDRKCDPLELDPTSSEGCTGLLRTIRSGNVSVVNAIGTALVEMPALIPFLPAAAKLLMDENLILPSIATYWCGDAGPRQFVLENLDRLIVRDAYTISDKKVHFPAEMPAAEKSKLVEQIKANPNLFVGQERLSHSLTPVFDQGRLHPWHLALRTFQLQTAGGIEVLPGGLARVSPFADVLGRSPTSGQLTQDCWVVSDTPVDHEVTLLSPDSDVIYLRRGGAELPSRVADQLFWLGRYVERCESIARLLRTTLTRLSGEDELNELPEMPRLVKALAAMGQLEPDYVIEGLDGAMPQLDVMLPSSVFDTQAQSGLVNAAQGALRNATAVRDRISLDAYRIFDTLASDLLEPPRIQKGTVVVAIERLNRLITHLLAVSGLTAESFTRTHGWRFVMLGRRIERATQTAELLATTLVPAGDDVRLLEAILEATDSLMTYRSRYLSLIRPAPALDLLVTDEINPRSLRFQLDEICRLLGELPTDETRHLPGHDEKLAKELLQHILDSDAGHLTARDASGTRGNLARLLDLVREQLPEVAHAIDASYLTHTSLKQTLTGERNRGAFEFSSGR